MSEKVMIPQEIVEQSKEMKRSHRSARSTPVYRDAANLKYLIVQLMASAPRKYAKYFDEMLITVSNAKQSLAFALEGGSEASREGNLSFAKVLIEDIMDDAIIMNQLGIIGREKKKTIRRLAQKVSGQAVKLRDYYKRQGIGNDV